MAYYVQECVAFLRMLLLNKNCLKIPAFTKSHKAIHNSRRSLRLLGTGNHANRALLLESPKHESKVTKLAMYRVQLQTDINLNKTFTGLHLAGNKAKLKTETTH